MHVYIYITRLERPQTNYCRGGKGAEIVTISGDPVCIYVFFMCVYVYVHVYMCVCVCVCWLCDPVCIHMYICVYVCVCWLCVCVCVVVSLSVCIYVLTDEQKTALKCPVEYRTLFPQSYHLSHTSN